jgi:hypothetical protein
MISVPNKNFPKSHSFIISRIIRRTPLRKYHISANSKNESPESFFTNMNKEVGHIHTYDVEYFKKIKGFRLIHKYMFFNGFTRHISELMSFEDNFNPQKRFFLLFKIINLFMVLPYILEYKLGFPDKDIEGSQMMVILKKI